MSEADKWFGAWLSLCLKYTQMWLRMN